jgi:hypothetical protein
MNIPLPKLALAVSVTCAALAAPVASSAQEQETAAGRPCSFHGCTRQRTRPG